MWQIYIYVKNQALLEMSKKINELQVNEESVYKINVNALRAAIHWDPSQQQISKWLKDCDSVLV